MSSQADNAFKTVVDCNGLLVTTFAIAVTYCFTLPCTCNTNICNIAGLVVLLNINLDT